MKVNNYPFTFVGLLILVIGWFAIFSAIFALGRGADDTLLISINLETMFVDASVFTAEQFVWQMALRIILGFLLVFIGNSFLVRGLHYCHDGICHPRLGDFRRLR